MLFGVFFLFFSFFLPRVSAIFFNNHFFGVARFFFRAKPSKAGNSRPATGAFKTMAIRDDPGATKPPGRLEGEQNVRRCSGGNAVCAWKFYGARLRLNEGAQRSGEAAPILSEHAATRSDHFRLGGNQPPVSAGGLRCSAACRSAINLICLARYCDDAGGWGERASLAFVCGASAPLFASSKPQSHKPGNNFFVVKTVVTGGFECRCVLLFG